MLLGQGLFLVITMKMWKLLHVWAPLCRTQPSIFGFVKTYFFFTRTEFAGQVVYRMVSPLRSKMERSWAGLITTNTPLVSRVSDELHMAQIMMRKCGNSQWKQCADSGDMCGDECNQKKLLNKESGLMKTQRPPERHPGTPRRPAPEYGLLGCTNPPRRII